MAEAAEAPLGDVPMLHTGELVASDAAATAHSSIECEQGTAILNTGIILIKYNTYNT